MVDIRLIKPKIIFSTARLCKLLKFGFTEIKEINFLNINSKNESAFLKLIYVFISKQANGF